jgi:glucose/mannose-6-phosphate isomerase
MDLNLLDKYSEVDSENFYLEIESLPRQIKDAWAKAKNFILPSGLVQANKVLICGMGGSGLVGLILKEFAQNQTKIPILTNHDYQIPKWVDDKTLVIAISHSGNTEETIDAVKSALTQNAKIIAISTGGEIEKMAVKHKFPIFLYLGSNSTRANIGNLLIACLGILKKIGIVKDLTDADIDEVEYHLNGWLKKINKEIPQSNNLAKDIANSLYNKIPIIWGSYPLSSIAIRWKNDFNENAKTQSYCESFPELNHNSTCGIHFPIEKHSFILILQSKFINVRNLKRIQITKELLGENNIPYKIIQIEPTGHILSEILCYTLLGEYISYYLGILYDQNPKAIPEVEFIKSKLK